MSRYVSWLGAMSVLSLWSGCMLLGVRTVEEARYAVAETSGEFELREYEAVVVAQTYVDTPDWDEAGRVGFRRLAGYIFGDNIREESIAMTAPVILEKSAEELAMTAPVLLARDARGWRMSFVLPSSFTLETAPRPLDSAVELAVAPPRRVAVLRYSGSFDESAAREKEAELEAWVAAKGLDPLGDCAFAGFDPPWTLPPLRRNEVWLSVR